MSATQPQIGLRRFGRVGLVGVASIAALAACTNTTPAPEGSASAGSEVHAHDHSSDDHDHGSEAAQPSGVPVTAGTVKVASALYPVEWLVNEIGGDHVEVISLVTPGQDAHDVELSPSQVQQVADADVVLRVKGLAPALDEAATSTKGTNIDLATLVELAPGDDHDNHDHDHGKDDHGKDDHDHDKDDHDHDHGHGSEGHDHDGHDHDGHDHDHGGVDPHFWLDPEKLADLAPKLADALGKQNPPNAKTYEENGAAVAQALKAKDTEWEQALKGCQIKPFVTTHAAFGYFANAYDLKQVPIKGINPDSEPTAEHLQEVRTTIQENGVNTVFAEPSATKALATSLAEDLKVEIGTLDPLESLSPDSPGKTYLEVMQANVDAITKANRC